MHDNLMQERRVKTRWNGVYSEGFTTGFYVDSEEDPWEDYDPEAFEDFDDEVWVLVLTLSHLEQDSKKRKRKSDE